MTIHNSSNIIYGFHGVEATLLKSPQTIDKIIIDKNRKDNRLNQLISLIKKNNIPYETSTNLDSIAKNQPHQGIVALLQQRVKSPQLDLKDLINQLEHEQRSIVLILDGITDVHNLGAIIRSADCFGVDAIIIPKNNSANTNNPIVAKVSSGAINHIPVISVNNISTTIEQLKQIGFWVAATTLQDDSISLFDFKCDQKIVWVLGSEGSGIRRLVNESCDYRVMIPMNGNTQSLNVSVAAGVVLAYTRLFYKNFE